MGDLTGEILNSVNLATCRNRERVAALRVMLTNLDTDPERAKRLAQYTCALCWYASGGMSGQAFSDWTCRVCGDKYSHPNTATPRVCHQCAEKHKLCHECGADMGMKARRLTKSRPSPTGEVSGARTTEPAPPRQSESPGQQTTKSPDAEAKGD